MPPKFQSSFIPKGPIAPTIGAAIPQAKARPQRDILSFLAKGIFALTILAAVGVVSYKWYLNYSIGKMSAELETARQEVASGVTGDLIRLNDRINSTESLIQNHRVISPLFSFLESSTPKNVRFTDFSFVEDQTGSQVMLRGAASSYAALAFEANVIDKDKDFQNPVFSDILLDPKGNVSFSLKASLSPSFVSYAKAVSRASVPTIPVIVATSTVPIVAPATTTKNASTTPKSATSTHP